MNGLRLLINEYTLLKYGVKSRFVNFTTYKQYRDISNEILDLFKDYNIIVSYLNNKFKYSILVLNPVSLVSRNDDYTILFNSLYDYVMCTYCRDYILKPQDNNGPDLYNEFKESIIHEPNAEFIIDQLELVHKHYKIILLENTPISIPDFDKKVKDIIDKFSTREPITFPFVEHNISAIKSDILDKIIDEYLESH